MSTADEFEASVRQHDERVASLGLAIWVGSEPTFTDRGAQSPEWLNAALGGDKEQRAAGLLVELARRFPGSLPLRSVGRRYPGEEQPRWNLGLYRRRDGTALWHGPADPILAPPEGVTGAGNPPDLEAWAAALQAALSAASLPVTRAAPPDPQARCLSVRDASAPADAGLFVLRIVAPQGRPTAHLELPSFADVPTFLAALRCIERACLACGLPTLILAGHAPPVDAEIELTTVTPDPAVIEINTAPSVDAREFLWRSREIYAAAENHGLAPYRLYFNGAVADSGGGGQITLGGPSPQASPFLREPRLLPRLVRFLNHHPALSYLFCHDFVGSTGQSARADERGSDAFDELALALELLERQPDVPPDLLWRSLAPFLCDAAGNSHRAELNIEKLWNPFLPERGQQGLVEFRALRMQHSPERATALACLLRAVAAMLARESVPLVLVDWGRELHERFALPFYLEQDLAHVLAALDKAGLGLGKTLESVLMRDEFRHWGTVTLPGCILEVRRALEFWPLLGDAASPEQGGTSRLVDSSTTRVELRLRPTRNRPDLDWRDWTIVAAGVTLPLRREHDVDGDLAVFGLRYRRFVPTFGLHPNLGAQTPVPLTLRHPCEPRHHLVTLHEWQPDGEAYAGLPDNLAEAARRRAERVTVQPVPHGPVIDARPVPPRCLGAYGLDLRGVS